MNFELTEEQILIRETAREFTNNHLLPGVIERDENQQFPKDQIKKLIMLVLSLMDLIRLKYIPTQLKKTSLFL